MPEQVSEVESTRPNGGGADDASFIGSSRPGHYGAERSALTLSETRFAGAWNVQGDAAKEPFVDALRWFFDGDLPLTPNTVARTAALTAFWLGPKSWLIVASGADAPVEFEARRDSLNAAGAALFEVSASRVAWTLAGKYASVVLAKSCPLDFHPRAFAEGACAQSMLGHVNALFYRRSPSEFTVLAARSYARDVWRSLCLSAAPYGYDVLEARAF